MLYEEDRFHPSNTDDNLYDDVPKKTNPSMFLEPIKKYECIISWSIGQQKIKLKIYKSCANIRNAVTGIQSEHLVGSKNESLYFKIIMPTIGTFFFDSPD